MRKLLLNCRLALWLCFVALASLGIGSESVASPDIPGGRRIVYMLAGQSNMAAFSNATGGACTPPGPTQANVTYWFAGPTGTSTAWPLGQLGLAPIPLSVVLTVIPPALTLGNRLGARHPNDKVELVGAALSGSSLLWRNGQAHGGESWVDPTSLTNPETRMRRLELAMGQLALGPQDELHIIWCQGESDCLPGDNTTTAEYSVWAQVLFGWMAWSAGMASYDVHLISLGSLNQSFRIDDDVNQVRDAFSTMPAAPIQFSGMQATILNAGHHYDLAHVDDLHLLPCEYVNLANRAVNGILNPGALPRLASVAPTVISATEFTLTTTVDLATVLATQAKNSLFDISVNGTPVPSSAFTVEASGKTLLFRLPAAALTTSTPISIRHVAGSGFGRGWETFPPFADAVLGLPLEPFLLL
jgi:hypothetical protein